MKGGRRALGVVPCVRAIQAVREKKARRIAGLF